MKAKLLETIVVITPFRIRQLDQNNENVCIERQGA